METPDEYKPITIEKTPTVAKIEFDHLELNAEHPRSEEIKVIVEKQPISLQEGKSYAGESVLIASETRSLEPIIKEAEALIELPEHERPAAVLTLLRKHINYPYKIIVEGLQTSDPKLAQWIIENIGKDTYEVQVPLSQLFEKGYGACRHLAVAYLFLAEKAGLKGCLAITDRTIVNIVRTDTAEKLFKNPELGATVSNHTWPEIQLSNGTWIPVDPSTQLVGDTPERLHMFELAHYQSKGFGLDEKTTNDALYVEFGSLIFKAGAARAETTCCLKLKSSKPQRTWTKAGNNSTTPATNTPYSGPATMIIDTLEEQGMRVSISEVSSL